MPCDVMSLFFLLYLYILFIYQPIPPILFNIFVIVINSFNAESMCLSKNNNKYSDNTHKYPSRPDSPHSNQTKYNKQLTKWWKQKKYQHSIIFNRTSINAWTWTHVEKIVFMFRLLCVCVFFMPSLWIHFN